VLVFVTGSGMDQKELTYQAKRANQNANSIIAAYDRAKGNPKLMKEVADDAAYVAKQARAAIRASWDLKTAKAEERREQIREAIKDIEKIKRMASKKTGAKKKANKKAAKKTNGNGSVKDRIKKLKGLKFW